MQRISPQLRDIDAPAPLRDKPYWMLWRLEQVDGDPRARKVPYWADGKRRYGTQGSPEDLARLTTFAAAREAAIRKGFDGVGFAHVEGCGVITLDFDNCVVDGKVRSDVLQLIGCTYAEYSPSGKGIHAVFTGTSDLVANYKAPARGDDFAVEAFSSKSFTTFTGWRLDHVDLIYGPDHIAPIPPRVVEECRARFNSRATSTVDTDDFLAGREPRLGLSIAEMEELLSHLDPSMGYDPWIKIGMALHHETEGDDTGFELWDTWSSDGDTYPDSEQLRYFWDHFEQRPGRPSVTMATVKWMAKEAGYDASKTAPRELRARRFAFTPVGRLEYRPPEFLVEDLIETDTLGLVFGDPGCGKSFLAVDVGLSVATGTAFHGRQVQPGPVFYIAGEGHNGLTRRVAAWSRDRGVSIDDTPLFMSSRAAQFLDGGSARMVTEAVQELAELHGTPTLIVVDTLARNFGPGDENSTAEMGKFITALDDLRAQFPGCAVMIVHHSGHGEKHRARGATALKAALDFEYRVEKSVAAILLQNTKMKDAEPPRPIAFKLETVELDDGASSAVLIETQVRMEVKPLTAAQARARSTFIQAAADSGIWEGRHFMGLHRDHWQAAFLPHQTGDNEDSKKKAFWRARKDLVEGGLLSVCDDVYLPECLELLAEVKAARTSRT